jgi:hypothetical protein
MPRDGDPVKPTRPAPPTFVSPEIGTARVVTRGYRALVELTTSAPVPAGPTAPAALSVVPPDTLVPAASRRQPRKRSVPYGERDLVELRIGRRKRRVFFVAWEDLRRADCQVFAPGWYVDTANPDPMWLNDDAFGPYATVEEATSEAYLAYRGE